MRMTLTLLTALLVSSCSSEQVQRNTYYSLRGQRNCSEEARASNPDACISYEEYQRRMQQK